MIGGQGRIVTAMPMRVLVARDYRQAYAHRARYFADPAMMAGRDRRSTVFKCRNIMARLPLCRASRVLDVGCGDGTLFRLIGECVARRCGIDPSADAVTKLRRLFEGEANVEFEIGTSEQIPYAEGSFDIVVMNAVMLHLSCEAEVVRTLGELVRVCAPAAVGYVGEMPFRPEGGATRYWTLLRHFGLGRLLRFVDESYLAPLARGEPLLVEPGGRTLAIPAERMVQLCENAGATVRYWRHPEVKRPSTTRNDYFLRVEKAMNGSS